MSLYLWDRWENDIQKIEDGNVSDIPAELMYEESIFRMMPMSSERAEGEHRDSTLSKKRAANARAAWVLSTNRLRQNLDLMNRTCETEEGKNMMSFEFRHFSRILQSQPRNEWRKGKLKSSDIVKHVYRLEHFTRQDWGFIVPHRPGMLAQS